MIYIYIYLSMHPECRTYPAKHSISYLLKKITYLRQTTVKPSAKIRTDNKINQ